LLSEQEVSKSWRQLFAAGPMTEETFVKAEALVEELRPENPLRHRLSTELAELRRMAVGATTKKPTTRRPRVKVS
jgi:hypothetical protein